MNNKSYICKFFQIFCVSYLFTVFGTFVVEFLMISNSFSRSFESLQNVVGNLLHLYIFLSLCGALGLFLFFGFSINNLKYIVVACLIGLLFAFFLTYVTFDTMDRLFAKISSDVLVGFELLLPFAFILIYGLVSLLKKGETLLKKGPDLSKNVLLVLVSTPLLSLFLSCVHNIDYFQETFIHSLFAHAYGFLWEMGFYDIGPTFSFGVAVLGAYFWQRGMLEVRIAQRKVE